MATTGLTPGVASASARVMAAGSPRAAPAPSCGSGDGERWRRCQARRRVNRPRNHRHGVTEMYTDAGVEHESSRGWVMFAATYLALAGAANLIWGITSLAKKEHFAEGGLVFSNLETWGWISLAIAGVQLVTAVLLGLRWFGGTLLAMLVAVCGVLANVLMFGALSGMVGHRDRLQRARAVGRDGARRRVHT